MTIRYRLADPAALIPMPDRGGANFPADAEGRVLDPMNPWHARLIADGSVVAIKDPASDSSGSGTKAKTGSSEGDK